MPESITLTIPLYRGLKTQIIDALKVTAHFAVHPALDVVVIKNIEGRQVTPWTVTHIPTLCRVVFSDSQEHAEQTGRLLESLPVDWNLPKCTDDLDLRSRKILVEACQRLSVLGICWSEWI